MAWPARTTGFVERARLSERCRAHDEQLRPVAVTSLEPGTGMSPAQAPDPTGVAAPDLEPAELLAVDAAIEQAIATGEAGFLRVLGYGEITLVVGWPSGRPRFAVKRLPPFAEPAQLERYGDLLRRYTGELEQRGTHVVPTLVRRVIPSEGAVRGYLVQPLATADQLLDSLLTQVSSQQGEALLEEVVARVLACVDRRVGLDAQVSNWVVRPDGLSCLDVSTPLLRSASGREELELGPFLSIYPAPLRPLLRLVARSVMASFHEPRSVLVDVAANLLRERLERWVPVLLSRANASVRPSISPEEVRRYLARDRRLWLLMQRLRRLDRAWQRSVRRRPYRFLLPPPYGYGPHELPSPPPTGQGVG